VLSFPLLQMKRKNFFRYFSAIMLFAIAGTIIAITIMLVCFSGPLLLLLPPFLYAASPRASCLLCVSCPGTVLAAD
jgi:hypothetical protein